MLRDTQALVICLGFLVEFGLLMQPSTPYQRILLRLLSRRPHTELELTDLLGDYCNVTAELDALSASRMICVAGCEDLTAGGRAAMLSPSGRTFAAYIAKQPERYS